AMNLHGYLTKNLIAYESEEAKDFANVFFMMMNYYTIERSMQIAKKKGKTFKDFEKSDYYNGKYFDKYTENLFLPVTDKVKELFKDIYVPTKEDWSSLKNKVRENGLYHAYRMA
ncbi:ribonucleotide-diphosphate reductase subunit alpha, partial [Streptococcus danieliae]|nr:ribonucleotide-diphosphate reductase subunit alpha [Streptococcus danieliae]